jgi:D-alanyl-D-alanine carboxypeptidase-like protein/MacB-like protein
MRIPVLRPRATVAGRTIPSVAFSLSVVVGLVAGGATGLLVQKDPRAAVPPATRPAGTPSTRPATLDTMLAWTPNGLPPGFTRRVRALPGVTHATAVVSGIVWMTRSISADGVTVSRPRHGMAFPLEMAGARLPDYAPFLSPADRVHLPDLARGQGVLGETEARLRDLGAGGTLRFGRRSVRVAGVVADAAIGANEMFVSLRTARSFGLHTMRYVLIDPDARASRAKLAAQIRGILPSGTPLRIRGPGETPYFRQGDAVLPQVRMKELFGEFPARPVEGGYLEIDPAWVSRHIVTTRVPLLGRIRCNRAVIPQLRGALSEVEASGLGQLINAGGYGGCFSPRFINRIPSAGISHHAWGAAVDINVTGNPFGRPPTQDRRLVAIFTRWGFTWGGRFLIPDGQHFEFVRFASGS